MNQEQDERHRPDDKGVIEPGCPKYDFAALIQAVPISERRMVLDVLQSIAGHGPENSPSKPPSKPPSKARGPDQGQGQARARDAPASPKA